MIKGAEYIIKKLNENGHKAYLVGGCVRDIIMNNIPLDYDITTSATPYEVISLFPHTIPTGLKHGTVTVNENGNFFEVTTFRIDGEYENFRKPKNVKYSSSLLDDIKRRDFTINAIAYHKDCGYIDYFNGINDIKNKIIRTVNDPYERISEDALRILRAIRFSSRFDFIIEENTLTAIKKLMHLTLNISKERIFDELNKMFLTNPYSAVLMLYETGFFDIYKIPVYKEKIKYLKNLKIKRFETVFAIILKDSDVLKDIKCSNKIKSNIKKIRESFSYNLDDKTSIKKMLYNLKCQDIIDLIFDTHIVCGLAKNDIYKIYEEIEKNKECYLLSHLAINGNDLINLGIKKEEISKVLDYLLNLVIYDNSLNKKEILIKKIQTP